MTITHEMRWRYHNDAQFHAQVYTHAARTCEADGPRAARPCEVCLEAAILVVSKHPWVGRPS